MAMVNFITVRTTPAGAVTGRYRNLLSVPYTDVILHSDAKWYCHGVTANNQDFYFGSAAGYASEAAAIAAIITLLP